MAEPGNGGWQGSKSGGAGEGPHRRPLQSRGAGAAGQERARQQQQHYSPSLCVQRAPAHTAHRLLQVSTARTAVSTVQRKIQAAEAAGEGGEDGDAAAAAQEREEAVDSLGFVLQLTAAEAEARARCDAAQEKQRAKWEALMAGGDALPPEDKLKRLCRKVLLKLLAPPLRSTATAAGSPSPAWLHPVLQGVPPELRRRVWLEVAGADARRREAHASYYPAMLALGLHESPFVHQIELDVPRTFPNNPWVQGEEGQAALRRVLIAFARHKPDVG